MEDQNNEEKINENMEKKFEDENDKKKVLKGEYYPIDVIEEAEKYYNLNIDLKEDLYPLKTYLKKNGLIIDFIKLEEININSQEINNLSVMGVDRGMEKSNENIYNIYSCSKLGKIFKVSNNNQITILKDEDKCKFRIICIDIFESKFIAGDNCGNIIIWINNNINKVFTNLNDQQTIL